MSNISESPDLDLGLETPRSERRRGCGLVNVAGPERAASGVLGGLLAAYVLRERSLGSLALAALGGALLYRGLTGHCPLYDVLGLNTSEETDEHLAHALHHGVHIERTLTIDKPVAEVYAFWRRLENLPHFMEHLESVTELTPRRSHWVAAGPNGRRVQWDAEILVDTPNQVISWRSLPGSDVINAGTVRFEPTEEGGTRLHVKLRYAPPAGRLGAAAARFLRNGPGDELTADLTMFKHLIETGG